MSSPYSRGMVDKESKATFQVDLSSYDTGDYDPGSLPKRAAWYVVSMLFFECRVPWPSSWKVMLLKLFGGRIKKGVVLKPGVRIKYPWFLSIGDHAWIGEGAWLDNPCEIDIGSNVTVSQGAYLLTGNHDYRSEQFDLRLAPITVGDGAWIAARALVSPGRKIGVNAVLSAGSVLLSDAKAGGVYVGNPATHVRERLPSGQSDS